MAGILAIRNPHHAGTASSTHCNSAEAPMSWPVEIWTMGLRMKMGWNIAVCPQAIEPVDEDGGTLVSDLNVQQSDLV